MSKRNLSISNSGYNIYDRMTVNNDLEVMQTALRRQLTGGNKIVAPFNLNFRLHRGG